MAGSSRKGTGARKAFTLAPYAYADARALVDGLRVAEPVAVTLVRRGYRTPAEARAFLEASESHDPREFDGIDGIVARIRAAIDAGRRITVHGDYDVDGVCATAILVRSLRALGADCDWYIPDRLGDGYGLTLAGVEALAARGTGLLITVDCGITSAAEVAAAQAAGIETIVTDHHQPESELPACPLLHPQLSGYPCPELCATGVAHKLAEALRGSEAVAGELDLVALATVADLVPLRGENRALVRRGLAEARRLRRPGLRALAEVAAVKAERLDEGDVAFRLAPRINAAGRLYRADAGVELMLTDDEARAREIAAELERANRERRGVEDEVLAGAERALRELPDGGADAAGLVLAGEGWHPGVVGIVASRMVERHWRPVVLVSLDGSGRARGSGRSIPRFDLLGALRDCDRHLIRYGGHRAAAGVELDAAELDAFRGAFAARAAEALDPGDLVRTEPVDAVVGGESLGHEVAEQLARLGPFGLGNPGVRLLVPGARIGDVRPMGEGDRHRRFSIRTGARGALGVAFGVNGELDAAATAPHDVSVKLELNEWNGAVEPRVVLSEVYPPEGSPGDRAVTGDGAPHPGAGAPVVEVEAAEFWARFDAELGVDLADWPPASVVAAARALEGGDGAGPHDRGAGPGLGRREVVDRRGASGIATVAALASTGEAVLVLCADALRRRALVESAVRPARFGGGEVALVAARLSLALGRAAVSRLHDHGGGVALADWPALAANPSLPRGFAHVVVVDPAPFADFDRLSRAGAGYLHLVAAPGDDELALRALAEEWPGREQLAFLYRALRRAADDEATIGAEPALAALSGAPGRYPRSPEAAARRLRVLAELGLAEARGWGASRVLRVVSSGATDLERSGAFRAYRRRREEGERYLSAAKQRS
ncbi:MAG TPA: single-stranded-DNA-specific exonuclease RecJ [Solirubrobacterales bacterium]|nr:single-stranded-DNA-specific exonuclease RecJ [Solirubrobacterales bacterium]